MIPLCEGLRSLRLKTIVPDVPRVPSGGIACPFNSNNTAPALEAATSNCSLAGKCRLAPDGKSSSDYDLTVGHYPQMTGLRERYIQIERSSRQRIASPHTPAGERAEWTEQLTLLPDWME